MKMFTILLIVIAMMIATFWFAHESTAPTPNNVDESLSEKGSAQVTYVNASSDRIVVDTPQPGARVGETFTVTGRARGGWYFEASFPLRVVSGTGSLITEMPVQADGEWMTAEFVPFSETVILPKEYLGPAMVILKNDNPSGLPENEASISIPIVIE